jgi:general secretion pathway protein J
MSRVIRTEPAFSEGGFTLLEVLVALAIFALASVIAYSGLDSVASTKSALDKEIRFWRELGLVFDRMETDFLQSVPHPLRDGPEILLAPLRGGKAGSNTGNNAGGGSGGNNGFFIELIRQDENRAHVRVRYFCERGRLTLRVRPLNLFGEVSGSAAPWAIDTPLLPAVDRCETAFLDANNAWLTEWPGSQTLARPQADPYQPGAGGARCL